MKRISFCLLILIASCQKESIEINTTRNEFIGYYCGQQRFLGSWIPFNTTVRKSEKDSNMIVFDHFVGSDTVEVIVNGYNLIIPENTYRIAEHTSAGPWGQTYYYDLTVSGNGTLYSSDNFLQLALTLKKNYEDGKEKVTYSVLDLYNSSRFSYIGTFSGDSTTVNIAQNDDSLLLSISFQEDLLPKGWANIKASEHLCTIGFFADSIHDISSDEIYELSGSAQKLGNSLKFTLFAYYHGISPLYIYDFTVTKNE